MQPPSSPPPGTPPIPDSSPEASPPSVEPSVPNTVAAIPPEAEGGIGTSAATDAVAPPQGDGAHEVSAPPGAVTTNAEIPLSHAPIVVHGPENASVVIPPFAANVAYEAPASADGSSPMQGQPADDTPGDMSEGQPPYMSSPAYPGNVEGMPSPYPSPDLAPVAPPFSPALAPENAPVGASPVRGASSRLRAAGVAAATVGACVLSAALLAGLGYAAGRLADAGFSYAFLTLEGLRFWVPGLLLAALAGVLVWLVAGRNPTPGTPAFTAGVFPFAAMLAGLLFLSVYRDAQWLVVAPVATGVALIVGTLSRLLLRDPTGGAHDIARTVLTISTYIVAFVTLAMVYINKLRSVQSATAVTLLCALLLLQMTDGEEVPPSRRLVYAVAGGLIVGQVTWIINYWSATGWTGGAFLLAVFYLVAGLSAAHLRGRIGLFDAVEFGGVAALALLIVSAAVLIQS